MQFVRIRAMNGVIRRTMGNDHQQSERSARSHQTGQSAGGFSISQKLLGLSNSSPISHEALSASGITTTTRPLLLPPFETSFTINNDSFFNCSPTITPQPWAFTTTVLHSARKSHAGSRLVITIAICRESRVLRLVSFLSSPSAVPPLGFNAQIIFQIQGNAF
jgi:hypothetical protein